MRRRRKKNPTMGSTLVVGGIGAVAGALLSYYFWKQTPTKAQCAALPANAP